MSKKNSLLLYSTISASKKILFHQRLCVTLLSVGYWLWMAHPQRKISRTNWNHKKYKLNVIDNFSYLKQEEYGELDLNGVWWHCTISSYFLIFRTDTWRRVVVHQIDVESMQRELGVDAGSIVVFVLANVWIIDAWEGNTSSTTNKTTTCEIEVQLMYCLWYCIAHFGIEM